MGHHFRLTQSETLDLTKDLALEFSQMPASLTERDLKAKRLAYLKDSVLGGTAISFNWARAKVSANGIVYRVNGHHSSKMLAGLNGAFPEGLKVHIDTFEIDDLADLGLLFRQFDNRLSSRTIDDISGAYQGLEEDLINVPKKAGRSAIEGIIWWKNNIIGDAVPPGDDKFDLFADRKLHPFIQMVGRVLSEKTPEFSKPVVAAMYGTLERSDEAEAFWSDVARQGGGNEEKHPATVLDAWLLAGRENRDSKPTEREIYRACALAWNAFRNHRSLEKIGRYDPKKGAPDLD